ADSAVIDLSGVSFMLQPRESNPFGGAWQGRVDQNGAFEMKSVSPDRYNLTAFGLPAGAYVKSVRTDDVGVLKSGLDLTSGASITIDIVVSLRAATVSGTVQNPKTTNPAPGATVVLIPQEKERREQQAY